MHINWLRVLGGGFLIEVVLFVVLLGGFAAAGIDLAAGISTLSAIVIGAGCFAAAFVVAAWLTRGIDGHRTLNGFLMGVVATLLYVGIVAASGMAAALAAYGPATFVIVNGVRVVGALLGGMVSERRVSAAPQQAL